MSQFLSVVPMLMAVAYLCVAQLAEWLAPFLIWAAPLAALCSLACLFWLAKRGLANGVHKGMVLFLTLVAVGWLTAPGVFMFFIGRAAAVLLYVCLLAAAALPPLWGGELFTEFFAKRQTPEAVRQTSIYRDINRFMSRVWCGLYLACALAASLPLWAPGLDRPLWEALFASVFPLAILLGVGLPFTKLYPGYRQRKLGITPVAVTAAPAPGGDAPPQASTQTARRNQMADKFKVVAVNGSPHVGIGNTSLMLGMLAEGIAAQGGEMETVDLAGLSIGYCIGCAVCLEKGKCWRNDDQGPLLAKLEAADAVILASPVYIFQVTGQMKTFLDRSLPFGHKPRPGWKPGLAVSVAAAGGEEEVAAYLARMLRIYGAWAVGTLTSLAVGPGGFVGKEHVEQRARDLARDLAVAVREKRRRPASGDDLFFWQFMSRLIKTEADLMADDDRHWREAGLYDSFESYIGQTVAESAMPEGSRQAWVKEVIRSEKGRLPGDADPAGPAPAKPAGPPANIASCRQLIELMPMGFNPEAGKGVNAVVQFEVSGEEEFVSHLIIADQTCRHQEGPAESPTLTITTPAGVWLAISKGEMDGQQAFMSGKYKVDGDLSLLMRFSRLFGGA